MLHEKQDRIMTQKTELLKIQLVEQSSKSSNKDDTYTVWELVMEWDRLESGHTATPLGLKK